MRFATTAIVLAAALLGCERPGDAPRGAGDTEAALAREVRWQAGSPDALVPLLSSDAPAAAEAAFSLAVLSTPEAVRALRENLPPDAPPEVVEAAALGLGYSRTDEAGPLLIELCVRDDPPDGGLEALYAHYRGPRFRGDRAPPTELPDARLLRYAGRESVRARAGLGWLTRVIHDPRLLGPVIALTLAPEPEVRRAAAMGLGQSSREGNEWSATEAARCVEALLPLLEDPDPRVVVAACRGLSSHDQGGVVDALRGALAHSDHNVRAAAISALGRLEAVDALDELERLARDDPSVYARYTAATTLSALDAQRAIGVADGLLASESAFLRAAGCEVLGAGGADGVLPRLVAVARDDPHPRVRGAALGALQGKEGEVVVAALRYSLTEEADPVVVNYACSVAAENGVASLRDLVRAVPGRFPTFDGADAREGALSALVTFAKVPAPAAPDDGGGDDGAGDDDGGEEAAPPPPPTYDLPAADRALIESHTRDPHPGVALTARTSLATVDGEEPPEPVRTRGPRGDDSDLGGTGEVLVVETSQGTLRIELDREQAPLHCAHVTALAERGFYDGLTWHRVVGDFVIQGGCPRGDGAGSAGMTLPLEPTRIPFERGVLGMPRSGHPDSGGCQLFIMHSRAPHLDVQYTAFGRVTEGLEVVDRIDVEDTIVRVRVADPTGR